MSIPNPHLALWRMVVYQAICDAVWGVPSHDNIPKWRRQLEDRAAKDYILGPHPDWYHICSMADVEPTKVRALALHLIENPPGTRKRKHGVTPLVDMAA